MNRTTNHIMKLDQAMTYDDAKKMQKFTEDLKGNERLKIEIGTTTFKLDNGTFETNITAIFTKTNKTNLEKIINIFEKIKNNIINNKSLFHKPELTENIFNYSSISAKKLNLHAKKMMEKINSPDLKKDVAAHGELITENELISHPILEITTSDIGPPPPTNDPAPPSDDVGSPPPKDNVGPPPAKVTPKVAKRQEDVDRLQATLRDLGLF